MEVGMAVCTVESCTHTVMSKQMVGSGGVFPSAVEQKTVAERACWPPTRCTERVPCMGFLTQCVGCEAPGTLNDYRQR